MPNPRGPPDVEYGAILVWLVVLHALALLGWPIAAVAVPRWSDRGATLGLPIALATITLVAFWVGHLTFGLPALGASLLVLVAASVAAVRFGGASVDLRQYADAGLVLTAGFLLFVAVRAVDPAAWPAGGEKFLDLGLLQSLLRAEALPPEDFWFAGEPLQYYYGGHITAALLALLTGTGGPYAYNLALAAFYATLLTTAYGLAAAISESHGHDRLLGGALGAFFVAVASNASTPARLAYWLLPDGLAGTLADRTALDPGGLGSGPGSFWYWDASRIIEGTINEFPLFAFYNGDLHAHMMSMPFVLLVAALLFAFVRTDADRGRRRLAIAFGAVPALGGLIATINTWSFPSVAGLTFLAVALGAAAPRTLLPDRARAALPERDGRVAAEVERLAIALLAAVAVVVLGMLWALPFFVGSASTRSIELFPGRSGLSELLLVHGAFLAVFAIYIFGRLPRSRTGPVAVALAWLGVILLTWTLDAPAVGLVVPLLAVGWLLLRRTDAWPERADPGTADDSSRPAAADAENGSPSEGESATDDDPVADGGVGASWDGVGYETLLLLAGAGLVVIVEFAYVQEHAGPERLNTVFKTYVDVWLFWGIAAGVMLAALLDRPWPRGTDLPIEKEGLRTVATVGAVVLVASLSLYGGLALYGHFDGPSAGTLDATHHLDDERPEEAAAIAWLDGHHGTPTMVEAPGVEAYSWHNTASSFTGIPTLAGWSHQQGYRSPEAYNERVGIVDEIYIGSEAEMETHLADHEVRFVYVGPNEHARYGGELRDFEDHAALDVVFEDEHVRIYEVDQDALDS